ncbi:MAG: small multi-drug export protein [Clostridia bacterium]|nr:small multi-drug export protein [Clostridia bacterium]
MRWASMSMGLLAQTAAQPAAQQALIGQEQVWKVIVTALLSLVPSFEGRYAIVTGIGMGLPLAFTFVLAFVMSTLPMPFIYWLLKPVLKWLYTLPFRPIQKFAAWVERRAEKKSQGIRAGSLFALFLFVAVPLPGTGVWTGSMIATLLEMDKKWASVVIVLGNLAACAIMTVLALAGTNFVDWVRGLF